MPQAAATLRATAAGSLEQITLRLGILHALEAAGVRVWNNPRAIERCVDKSTATWRFQHAGLPVPETRTAEGAAAATLHRRGRGTLVLKPLFGSQGNGVRRLAEADDLPPPDLLGNVYYLQEYLRGADATSFEDWRVLVSKGRVLAAMMRRGKTWLTNVHQGAEPVAVTPDAEMQSLALRAAEAVGASYAGVDLIRAVDGRLLVLEINSNPAWKGLQSVTGFDIAEVLADDFLAEVKLGAAR
jgi:RimK family alpha-L-glutamate ligase